MISNIKNTYSRVPIIGGGGEIKQKIHYPGVVVEVVVVVVGGGGGRGVCVCMCVCVWGGGGGVWKAGETNQNIII